MKSKYEEIMNEMYIAANSNTPMSPNWWIDKAMQLEMLSQEIVNEVYKERQNYKLIEKEMIATGSSAASAAVIAEISDHYYNYKTRKAYYEMIQEIVKLAKARSKMDSEFTTV